MNTTTTPRFRTVLMAGALLATALLAGCATPQGSVG